MAGHTNHTNIYDRLFVLDLDRCLITDRAYSVLDDVVVMSGIVHPDSFRKARQEHEASGGSFDSISWLMRQNGFSESQRNQLLAQYIEQAQRLGSDTLLAPGARAFLAKLQDAAIPHMIMTYGGQTNQLAKLQAAGLESIPSMIVDHKNKADYIAKWWDEIAGLYTIPMGSNNLIQVRTVILVDDKATAFTNLLPAPFARGYWVQFGELLLSQEGPVPSNVTPVKSFQEIFHREKHNFINNTTFL